MSARTRCVAALVLALVLIFGAVPPVYAAQDYYEYLDNLWDNTIANRKAQGTNEALHTFQTADPAFVAHDEDWAVFLATAGKTYQMSALPDVGSSANPVLAIWDTNGTVELARSDDAVLGRPDARIDWTCPFTGLYSVQAIDWYGPSQGAGYELNISNATDLPAWTVTRPNAPDRYELAANVAAAGWPGWAGVKHVIVACGADRAAADPLAASGLAGVYDAPILLVQTDPSRTVVPGVTKNTLAAIRAATGAKPEIHVVGGPASVTPAQLNVLKAYDKNGVIDRIGGADRYQVAANIAARMRSVLGAAYPKTAIYVNGRDAAYFWDALAAGPIAFKQHFPLLLTTKSEIPVATNAQRKFYTTKYAVGTPTEFVPALATTLGATRIGWDAADGPSYRREVLARRLAEYAAAPSRRWLGYDDEYAFRDVAFANRLADSLVGGAFMGKKGGAMLYTHSATLLDPIYLSIKYHGRPTGYNSEFLVGRRRMTGGGGARVWILGGNASVSDWLFQRIQVLTGSLVG